MRAKKGNDEKKVDQEKRTPPDLEEARAQFLAACNDFSPFDVVKRRPFASLGTAFLAGFGLNMLGSSRVAPPAFATAAQITSILMQLAPLIEKRARSSDG